MDVEIITIGDELITGFNVDTNSAFIADRLTAAGFTVKFISSVGDSLEDMEEVFRLALKRVQVVITTGGLGPTDDDLTKRAIVKVFKRNLIFHEEILEALKERFRSRGMEMPAINQNQALLPQGAAIFPNKFGSAVGLCIHESGRVFISLPGVPHEMRQIIVDEVVPYLQAKLTGRPFKSVTIRTAGIFESKLAEIITADLRLEPGVKLAYLPSYRGVTLRVFSEDNDQKSADEKADRLVQHIQRTVGNHLFGYGEDTLEGAVGQLLIDNDKTLSVAESCTAGELGMTITSVPGSSDYFVGGLAAYSNAVKIGQLEVPEDVINTHGAVSEECAVAMAAGCRKLFGTDYALSITGIAGPEGGTAEKPVGLTFIGLASAHANYAKAHNFGKDREFNRHRAVFAALEMLRREILDIK
jgi:nicotinamide-nucleotide amidase